MRSIACLVVLLLCVTASCQTLICGRATAPPAIDGSPGDPCWDQAMVATDFSVLGSAGTERAFRQTTVRAAWDEQALYFHAICLEPDPASITAKVTERDGSVWLEDALEVFLVPDIASGTYYHFIVNAGGVLYDELGTSADYNAAASVAAVIDEQAWQVEMAIPWAELSVSAPQAGAEWGFNVGREHRPVEPTEWSTWAPLEQDRHIFGLSELFGRLRFEAAATPGRAASLSLPPGLVRNPGFSDLQEGRPVDWSLPNATAFSEIASMGRHYSVWNDGSYGIADQATDVPVEAGDIFTVFAVARCSPDARLGIAVVQEMEDGRPDDLYPFWNLGGTEQYRVYSGRIVVDKGARRLFSVRLYRANKEGWVDYAYVQVLPGIHGLSGIVDAEKCTRPDQRGLGAPWRTPALQAYKPLPGGPVRALIFIGEFQRDAVELAQRLDMDYDLIYCPLFRNGKSVENVSAYDAGSVLRRLARGDYQLIILAGRPSEQVVIDGILDSVRRGTGLLAVDPVAGVPLHPEVWDSLQAALPATALGPDAFGQVLGAIPPEVLAATSPAKGKLQSLACGDLEQGRIAHLTWDQQTPGLIPFARGAAEYWEYRWAALCRAALWACRREPESAIASVAADDELHVRLGGPVPADATLTVTWDQRLEGGPADIVAIPDTVGAATIPIPEESRRVRGPVIARVLLSAGGRPLDVGACLIPTTDPRVQIGEVKAPETFAPGEPIQIAVDGEVFRPGQTALKVGIVDAFDRVVAEAVMETDAVGEFRPTVQVAVSEPLSVYHVIRVTAVDGGIPVDETSVPILCPQAGEDDLDDFSLAAGYAAMTVRCPPHLEAEMVAFLRSRGVQACTVNRYMIARGMPAFGGMISGGMRHSSGEHVRQNCFSRPEEVEKLCERTVKGAADRVKWGFVGYNMEDEVHLHQSGSTEVCTCEACRGAFAAWAGETYGTIQAVNEEWGTKYTAFEDITVPLVAEMKGERNPARWVDFRLLMERTWANAYARAHRSLGESYPGAKLSFTNPYKYNSLSGVDFSLWVPNEEILLRYFHRHVVDRNKSWSRAPMLSWFGYESSAQEVGRFVWWFALNGGVMPIWWDPVEPWAYTGKEGFTPWYMLTPLWEDTARSRAVTSAAADLQAGIGKVLRVAEPAPPEAVILHSQPSMHVLFAQPCLELGRVVDTGYGRYRASDDALAAALKSRGLNYRYALPRELTAESLQGVQLLALPSCVALSDETLAAVRAFVAAGGKVLADLPPGTHDEHGRPRTAPALADLFAPGRASCLGRAATAEDAADLDKALDGLQVQPVVRWEKADGTLPSATEMYRYRLGRAEFIGLCRDATPGAAEEGPLTLTLPGPAHVYDCRAGEYLGQRAQIVLDIPGADAAFLCLLPYRPEAMQATAQIADGRLRVQANLAGVADPTDHLFRVEVTPPRAAGPALWYSKNLLAPGGSLEWSVPLAQNDPEGRWTVTVKDVATGLRATTGTTLGEE